MLHFISASDMLLHNQSLSDMMTKHRNFYIRLIEKVNLPVAGSKFSVLKGSAEVFLKVIEVTSEVSILDDANVDENETLVVEFSLKKG